VAFADPQSITINAIANSLPRTGSGNNEGTFTKDDANLRMEIKHNYAKRTRSVLKLTHRKVATDPLVAAQNLNYSMGITISVDRPPVGYTPTEVKQIWDGLLANLAASSGANTIKLLGGES
jgi:hypothetical protein